METDAQETAPLPPGLPEPRGAARGKDKGAPRCVPAPRLRGAREARADLRSRPLGGAERGAGRGARGPPGGAWAAPSTRRSVEDSEFGDRAVSPPDFYQTSYSADGQSQPSCDYGGRGGPCSKQCAGCHYSQQDVMQPQ
ncbi:hypothetical protein QTO34_016919 [Cnephaeus nilssonii]|uniref:Uncharacterized protein n=1 Tax=Cnephaeus nilssonii TaxID=3371016 RepID=A0AA40I424_CNENI|nr:hypothetical protein QTO34_016919 [Eptesicus nilssonii]